MARARRACRGRVSTAARRRASAAEVLTRGSPRRRCDCSTSRPSGSSMDGVRRSGWRRAGARLRRRRRGALHQPVGPRLPAGVPRSSAQLRERFPGVRVPRATPRPPRRASGATSSPSCACGDPRDARRIVRPAEPRLSRASAHGSPRSQVLAAIGRHRDEAGIVYCSPARGSRRAGGVRSPRRGRARAAAITRASSDQSAHRNQDAFLNERRRHRRRDRARSAWASTAPTCGYVMHAGVPQVARALSAGSRARRPRWPRRRSACCW